MMGSILVNEGVEQVWNKTNQFIYSLIHLLSNSYWDETGLWSLKELACTNLHAYVKI